MLYENYPSIEYVSQCLREDDGKLFWLSRPLSHFPNEATWKKWNSRWTGKEAGSLQGKSRYRNGVKTPQKPRWIICVSGIDILRYIIIWAFHNGKWPKTQLDHKDQDPLNDFISNLRECNQSSNNINTKIRVDNTSGHKGVSKCGKSRSWRSYINVNGIRIEKRFKRYEDACDFYDKMAEKHYGEFFPKMNSE